MKPKRAKKKMMKEKEQTLLFRAMSFNSNLSDEEEGRSQEAPIYSQQESTNEDRSLEDYLSSVQEDMMEFKLSYEMWRVGHWVVTVPNAQREDEELCFTVHIEERDNPENLHWDVKKTRTDVIHFRNLWQVRNRRIDFANLPSLSVLERNIEEDFKGATISLQLFLQELVSDALMGNNQTVFQFLCPLDKLLCEEECVGGVWSLLSGLAEFLTPAQEEDEERHNSLQRGTKSGDSNTMEVLDPAASVNLDENIVDSKKGRSQGPLILISQWDDKSLLKPNSTECCENKKTVAAGKSDLLVNAEKTEDKTDKSESPVTFKRKTIQKGLSRSEECLAQMKLDTTENQNVCTPRHGCSLCDLSDSPCHHLGGKSNKKEKLTFKMSGGISKSKGKDVGSQSKLEDSHCLKKDPSSWEHIEATKAIFDLLKAISGNSIFMNIFDAILKPVMLILKKKVNSFLNKIRPTEAQLASYIDILREKQWPEGLPKTNIPKGHRSSEEKNDTKDRAQQLINARYSNYLILKKTDVETVFKLFQDPEENKKLVYMLLSFLLKKLLPDEDALKMNAVTLQKVNAN
ncbi:uncharacterized protein si:rp71-46j2.7 [Esox lucius]|uniref:uncharacterized protein si:rp71-46j2.7 n=1 Tax=Esox lucius TaxID=8010 RepID=UPI0014776459|nr:uncharacterized protein si:rp71-46j2.7 [Esox lucius]